MATEETTKLNQIQLDYREKVIAQAHKDGLSLQEISEIFGISKARVHQIVIGYRAKQIK